MNAQSNATTRSYSIVIPAYNDAEGLRRHLTYFQNVAELVQLVIVDDCSEDHTRETVAATQLPGNIQLTYHRQAVNGGPAMARNTGIDLATRDYLLFLDADDLLADSFFDYMRMAPLENGADFVLFKYHLAGSLDERYSYEMHRPDRSFFSGWPADYPIALFSPAERVSALSTVNFPWNKCYRRTFLLEAGIRFPDIRMHEDITPHWQSFLRCEKFGVMYWAPPLLTHFELRAGGRATDYIGEKRLGVFEELSSLRAELAAHPQASELEKVFETFCADLFTWMTSDLCSGSDAESRHWAGRYRDAIASFRGAAGSIRYSPPPPGASNDSD